MRATAVFSLVLAHLSLCQGWTWTCTLLGPQLSGAVQVDAGQGKLVATDTNRQAYILTGSSWTRLPFSDLKHITVGEAGIWGTHNNDLIYKYVSGSWVQVSGRLIQIDAGVNDFVVGANRGNHVYCLRSGYAKAFDGHSSIHWNEVGGRLKYYSCGPYGCWGVNSGNAIYFNALKSAATCSFSGWKHIPGSLKMIEVGNDGNVFGVNSNGLVFQRIGISKEGPDGSDWQLIPMSQTMRHVSYDAGSIYAVSTSGAIMKCTQEDDDSCEP